MHFFTCQSFPPYIESIQEKDVSYIEKIAFGHSVPLFLAIAAAQRKCGCAKNIPAAENGQTGMFFVGNLRGSRAAVALRQSQIYHKNYSKFAWLFFTSSSSNFFLSIMV